MICCAVASIPKSDDSYPPPLPLSYHSLPLEVGPLNLASGSGGRCKLPSGSGQRPAAKRYIVHCRLKSASGESNFEGTFMKSMFVFYLFTSNSTSEGIY